ncbi:MAG TPA: dihydroorotate dehydrogenase electron transfer subunit [Candidatus Hydrogenedentes bacterium]|nr:dihydroorotate dehydrogenase electron transfer subunit [Candidatus Hydrogenedentota bacterium]HRK36169.1 dihydroorotate dehydrogenase electron transfer subunit [Candidatus Hydrogenedentota bacterium]
MRYLLECEVVENEEVAPEQFRMRINAPELSRSAVAGQFCMLQVAEGLYPFLRRPMCFERITRDHVSILYKVEGEGTHLLSKMRPGTMLGVQGPLGKGFPIERSFERHIIVAGGIGVATFPALAEALVQKCDIAPEVVLAARSKHLILCADEFRAMGCKVHIATDDGSAGEKLYASQMLAKLKPGPGTRVYVCGPMIMMKTTSDVAVAAGADCVVSLEAQMACGDGACLGCVVESKSEQEGEKMVRVCLDGPVFDTAIIDWEAHNMAFDR